MTVRIVHGRTVVMNSNNESNTEDQQLTEGWDQTYTGQPTTSPGTNELATTDWVRQQVLNNRAKVAGYESPAVPVIVPLGEGWTIGKQASPQPEYELATTEYVDQQVAEAMDSIRDSMAMSSKWTNKRIEEEIAKEKASALWFLVGLVGGILSWWWWYR